MSETDLPAGPAADPSAPLPAAAAQPVEPPSAPLASRLAGVVFSPAATFRSLVSRPAWIGALAIYLAAIGVSALVYSLNVDWEALMRGQFEDSVGWKLASSMMPENKLNEIEHGAIEEILSTGSGGMTLLTTANTLTGGAIGFLLMGIVYGTLFYLMGALGEMKLGRIFLDGFICLSLTVVWVIVGALLRSLFGNEARDALPWQAGLNSIFFLLFLYMLYRAIERQPAFKRLMSVYAHGLAISAVAALLVVVVVLLQSEPVTVGADQVLRSNLGALMGMKGTGVAATLLTSLDIFTLWQLVVLSIGFAALTGFSIAMSASITFLPWGFVTMAKLAIALLFGA